MNFQKHNNNATLSIGTESTYSATSPDVMQKQIGGGLLSFLEGSNEGSYATSLSIDAFNKQMPQVGCFIIRHVLNDSYSLDFSKTDSNSRNLLHLLVIYSAAYLEAKKLLCEIVESQDVSRFLNTQDSQLNTPCHYALSLGMEDIVKLCADKGADLTIKNADGFSIELKSIPVQQTKQNNKLPVESDIFMRDDTLDMPKNNDSTNEMLDRLISNFVPKKNNDNGQYSTDETIGFDRNQLSNASTVRERRNATGFSTSQSSELDSQDILNMILNDNMQKNNQQGGGKNMSGTRKIVTYSEVSIGGSTTSDQSMSDDLDSISSMARAVENKASEAHKRTVERIKEILGVDDEEARAYKALLYDAIKKDSPQLSNYDRAMELEKRASDKSILDKLSKTDVKNMMKKIKSNDKEKEKKKESINSSTSETRKDKKKKKEPVSEGSSSLDLDTISTIEM